MPNSDDDRDGRRATAKGYVLAMRVMSIAFQMAVPPGVGWWLDQRYATAPWFVVGGVLVGFAMAMLELMKLAKDSE
jgi:F0F1-type ATP synthase assembly protein I